MDSSKVIYRSDITKSPNDDRSFRYIKLSNQLKVILIQDPETTKSYTTMHINVGSALDPKEFLGLAHFLEHILLLGTEKYPNEEEFSKHCSDFGGNTNASTDISFTYYYFEISNEGFNKALDMFAQFFISPLFNEWSAEKEMTAINHEHEKNVQNDFYRYIQLTYFNANPKSAFNRFTTGNKESLDKDGWFEALKEFYKKWYSANIMHLVVSSNKQLDELEQQVSELFSNIENKNVEIPSFGDPPIYPKENLGYLFTIKPVRNQNVIRIKWFYNDWREKDIYNKPTKIVRHILGHEGKNSLLSYLIKNNLANDLFWFYHSQLSAITFVLISISLTDEGLEQYQRVIEVVMKMVKNLQREGPIDHVYEEVSNHFKLQWEIFEKDSTVNFTNEISVRMKIFDDENMKDILSSEYLFPEFDKDGYQKVLNDLSPEFWNIYLLTQNENFFLNKEILKVKYYGWEYTKEKFSEDLVNLMNAPNTQEFDDLKLSNPSANLLFPKNLEINKEDSEEIKTMKIYSDNKTDVWLNSGNRFKSSKVIVHLQILTNDWGIGVNSEGNAFISLWIAVIKDYFREFIYTARMAWIELEITFSEGIICLLLLTTSWAFLCNLYRSTKVYLQRIWRLN